MQNVWLYYANKILTRTKLTLDFRIWTKIKSFTFQTNKKQEKTGENG